MPYQRSDGIPRAYGDPRLVRARSKIPPEWVPVDDGDDRGEADRAALHASLDRAAAELRAGLGVPTEEAFRRLLARRT